MSFLEISYFPENNTQKKQIRMISCEQIVGQHLKIPELEFDIREKFRQLTESNPEKYHLSHEKNRFIVIGPNGSPITYGTNGKSPWFLVRGVKEERKQLTFLMIGRSLWGIEISTGLRMKKSIETKGKQVVLDYLSKQVRSLLNKPDDWTCLEGYCV